jgi:hypothetical protein
MELADFIRLGEQEPALPFVIIGGYALAEYGLEFLVLTICWL